MTENLMEKDEFVNEAPGWVGCVVRKPDGSGFTAIGVKPGDSVMLDQQEQMATANAPKVAADNPLANGQLRKIRSGSELKAGRSLEVDPALAASAPAPTTDEGLGGVNPTETPITASPEAAEREAAAQRAIAEAEEREAAEKAARDAQAAREREAAEKSAQEAAEREQAAQAASAAAARERIATPQADVRPEQSKAPAPAAQTADPLAQ